jgi:membrane protein implicated in regulation of membrane protease activity
MENWIVWLIVAVGLLIAEMVTPGAFFFACLGMGALVTALAVYLEAPSWLSWFFFFGSSLLFVLIARPIARKCMEGETRPSNVDELVGQEAFVVEAVVPHKSGQVKVAGEIWKAKASEEIPAESLVEIQKVEGTHLVVRKK